LGVSVAFVSALLLVSPHLAAPALAVEETALAFVLGPGSHLRLGGDVVQLPEGGRLELLVYEKGATGRFRVQVRPGGLVIPQISLGEDGGTLQIRLSEGSTGWLEPEPGGVIAEVMATLQVELVGERGVSVGEYPLVLTTESRPGSAESERGSMIDYSSGWTRLVAKNTMAADSPVAPGETIVVVLEGAFEGVPASLR
jgi:hypothetical protein